MTITTEIRKVEIEGYSLRVAIRSTGAGGTPLLLFNGIGARLELLEPFIQELGEIDTVVFDIPGIGESSEPTRPYRLFSMARLADKLMTELGHTGEFDVFGVSWGGGLAQQYAFQYRKRCRRLVLAATSQGIVMVPGRVRSLLKMISPRRFVDPDYLMRIGPEIYGGDVRGDPDLVVHHASSLRAPKARGYLYQILAAWGWTSIWWLRLLPQPTLILAGTDDPLMPVANARLMRRLIGDAELHLVDDGHLFIITRAKEVAAIVRRFLTDARPAPRPENEPEAAPA